MKIYCFGIPGVVANSDDRPLDTLLSYHMDKSSSGAAPIRYAVRQVLDQELNKEKLLRNSSIRHARSGTTAIKGIDGEDDKENQNPAEKAKEPGVKRDFFGRIMTESRPLSAGKGTKEQPAKAGAKDEGRIWVSFHEGYSNAVRKPITLKELMDGF